jgi:hypothetical protein
MEDLKHDTEMIIKKKSLYNISFEHQQLMESIMEAEGEITDEQSEFLAINEKDLKNKSRSYIAVINKAKSDNAFIESLWKSVKYEKIYLNPPEDGWAAGTYDGIVTHARDGVELDRLTKTISLP